MVEAVLDWYSRFVVSWELDQTLHIEFVLSAARRALERGRPRIWNSDQGSHFTSPQYTGLLLAADVRISMDGAAARYLHRMHAVLARQFVEGLLPFERFAGDLGLEFTAVSPTDRSHATSLSVFLITPCYFNMACCSVFGLFLTFGAQ